MWIVTTHRLNKFGIVTSNGLTSTRLQIYVELNDELTIPQLALYQTCLRGAFALPTFDYLLTVMGCWICIRLSCHLINRLLIIKFDESLPEFMSSFAFVRMSVVVAIFSKVKPINVLQELSMEVI